MSDRFEIPRPGPNPRSSAQAARLEQKAWMVLEDPALTMDAARLELEQAGNVIYEVDETSCYCGHSLDEHTSARAEDGETVLEARAACGLGKAPCRCFRYERARRFLVADVSMPITPEEAVALGFPAEYPGDSQL